MMVVKSKCLVTRSDVFDEMMVGRAGYDMKSDES